MAVPMPEEWLTSIQRGHFIGIVWGDEFIRWQVYIPTGTPRFQDGKIVAGGTNGSLAESKHVAIDAVEGAIASALNNPELN